MGLVFAIQPDLRHSEAGRKLVLRSSKRRFALGGGFVFGGALLGTMFLAASPLFKVLWNEGSFFDQLLTAFFYLPIFIYPFLALVCWFYEEVVVLEKNSPNNGQDTWNLIAYDTVFGLKWNHRKAKDIHLEDLSVENWKGPVNVAALDSQTTGQMNRYATRGHWMLKVRQSAKKDFLLERRAKREDIEFLKAQIESEIATKTAD